MTSAVIRGDNPITGREDDRLARLKPARAFANQLRTLDASEGAVVGVLGPWGSGKTSFVNLARLDLKDAGWTIVDFNPWMFSGAEQLVDSFFIELTAQLRVQSRFRDLADSLERYGEVFSSLGRLPVVGPWIDLGRGIAKVVRKEVERRRVGVSSPRDQVRRRLAALDQPIAIVIDDLDRLRTSEIRDIFKLVRLTASFPNLIYILAFDRQRVEKALAEDAIPGRDYLEKILQTAIDLPAIPPEVLTRETLRAIDAALSGLEAPGPFDNGLWVDVFMEIVRPLIRNMRDVNRYVTALRGTVVVLEGEVALVDVMALESVRVFLPDVFALLPTMTEALTTPTGFTGGAAADPSAKAGIQRLIDSAGARGEVIRNLILRVFPAGQRHLPQGMHYGSDWLKTWLKGRRVAHQDFLRLYLELAAGQGLTAFIAAERAVAVMHDAAELDTFLRSLPADMRVNVIAAIENWDEEFERRSVVPASTVLLNLIPDLPERQQGMFDLDTKMIVGRVVYRLLRSLADANDIQAAVLAALPELRTHSAKLSLITYVGHRERAGHKLIDEAASKELEVGWRAGVRAASAAALAKEWDLLRVLYLARHEAVQGEPELQIEEDPHLNLAIFKAAIAEVRSQSLGDRAVRRTPRLAWDVIVELFRNEDAVRARLAEAKGVATAEDGPAIELVERYLAGWRPKELDV
jgi:hypothetical protein